MVRVNGGAGDTVVFNDSDNWRMASPLIDSGRFYRVAVNQVSSEQLQLDDPSSAWGNLVAPTDVDAGGTTSVLDALLIITEAEIRAYSDSDTSVLDDPLSVESWPGRYFDVSRDGRLTTLDALQVLNWLARIDSGEGEAVPLSQPELGEVGLTGDSGDSRPVFVQDRQRVGLILGNPLDPIAQPMIQIQWELEDHTESMLSLPEKQSRVNTVSDSLVSEPQCWADRVDQLLVEDLGFPEHL